MVADSDYDTFPLMYILVGLFPVPLLSPQIAFGGGEGNRTPVPTSSFFTFYECS